MSGHMSPLDGPLDSPGDSVQGKGLCHIRGRLRATAGFAAPPSCDPPPRCAIWLRHFSRLGAAPLGQGLRPDTPQSSRRRGAAADRSLGVSPVREAPPGGAPQVLTVLRGSTTDHREDRSDVNEPFQCARRCQCPHPLLPDNPPAFQRHARQGVASKVDLITNRSASDNLVQVTPFAASTSGNPAPESVALARPSRSRPHHRWLIAQGYA